LVRDKKEASMTKIFVRHRRHVGQGAGRPRFAIVAAQGADLKVFKTRVRRAELEKIAADLEAEIVYLPRGDSEDEPEKGSGKRRRHHRGQEKG
jgi:uncharacterized protein involved in propanediol utilization